MSNTAPGESQAFFAEHITVEAEAHKEDIAHAQSPLKLLQLAIPCLLTLPHLYLLIETTIKALATHLCLLTAPVLPCLALPGMV